MIKRNRRFSNVTKNESCSDPRELLLSLVDMGSIDSDDMLVACVSEMSDAECKRVLNSLALPECAECEDDEVEFDGDVEPVDDVVIDTDKEDASDGDEPDEDDSDEVEFESRIARLERSLRAESRKHRCRR